MSEILSIKKHRSRSRSLATYDELHQDVELAPCGYETQAKLERASCINEARMKLKLSTYGSTKTSISSQRIMGALRCSPLPIDAVSLDVSNQKKKMSILVAIFNLTKALLGGGILALPASMAAGRGTGYLTAMVVVCISAFSSGYTYYQVGVCFKVTQTCSFKDLLMLTHGPKAAAFADSIVIATGLAVGMLYQDYIADLATLLWNNAFPDFETSRMVVLSCVTVFVTGPLCFQKELRSLRFVSYVGIVAVLYIVLFMAYRLLDGSYSSGSLFSNEIQKHMDDTTIGLWDYGLGTCVLVASLSTSYTAHATIPQFACQLEDFSNFRFSVVVSSAYAISSVFYISTMYTGFMLFGISSKGDILENYAKDDVLAKFAQCAFGLSVLGSTPIFFSAFREAVAGRFDNKTNIDFHILTGFLLSILLFLSFFVTDVGFIVPMIGSLTDGPIKFFIPPLVFFKVSKHHPKLAGIGTVILNYIFLAFGFFLTFFTAYTSYLNTYTKQLQ